MTHSPVSLRGALHNLLADGSHQMPGLSPEQWGSLVDLATDHEVAGYLYKRVRPYAVEWGIPPDALARLNDHYRLNQVHYFQFASRTIPIFEAFNKHGIRFFVYKGVPLIEHYYRDPGLRAITDVDLVVQPEDIPAASEIIRDHGFVAWNAPDLHFYQEDLCLDVHQDLFRLDRVPSRTYALADGMDAVRDRLVPCSFPGSRIARLDPIDEFIVSSWHALKHSFSLLKWLVDLKLLYQDLSGCPEFARRMGALPEDSVRAGVWYALRLLHEWFRVPIPQTLLQALAPRKTSWIERRAFDRIQAGTEAEYCFAEFCFLRTIKGTQGRLAFVRDMLRCGDSEQKGWRTVGTMLSRAGRWSPSLFQQTHLLLRGR